MVIYIEDVIISNILITLMQLNQINKIFVLKGNKKLFFLSSVVGAIFSLIYPLLKLNSIFNIVYKLLVTLLIIKIAFWQIDFKKVIILTLGLVVYSSIFSGITTFFTNETKINSIFLVIPYCIISYIIERIKNIAKNRLKVENFLYKTEFELNGKKIESMSFMDSGNTLKYQGKSLMIVNLSLIMKFYPENKKDIIPFQIEGCLDFESVNTKGKIYLTKFDKIVIYKEEKHIFNNIIVGININNFKTYDMLFSLNE